MIFPSVYFGSIGYYRELVKYSTVYIEAKEHFPKQTYRNRCDILSANGIIALSIPVRKPDGTKTAMDHIEIVEDGWREIHWRSIRSAYESAPFFEHFGPEIKALIFLPESKLIDFNIRLLNQMREWLELPVSLCLTENFTSYTENDPRIFLAEKHAFQKSEEVAPYLQVFPGPGSYRQCLSILDVLFCEGPLARNLLIR